MCTRQLDREQVCKFKKVTQRSILNSSKILMWRILLQLVAFVIVVNPDINRGLLNPHKCIYEYTMHL